MSDSASRSFWVGCERQMIAHEHSLVSDVEVLLEEAAAGVLDGDSVEWLVDAVEGCVAFRAFRAFQRGPGWLAPRSR